MLNVGSVRKIRINLKTETINILYHIYHAALIDKTWLVADDD